ncbi:NAD(P)-dependent oxidoreductase [Pseudomonas sp. EL_65y_Pfl2_R95]|uniref:NAD(P)-dependent oxidoreductase n=1 Tax=Pseudomonas sp. EL_65y_Pfl2_R95 TaxID=3088698 RepID=UPI0030DC438A
MRLTVVTLIGYGEAGHILAQDLVVQGVQVKAYDRLIDTPKTRAVLEKKAAMSGVQLFTSAGEAVQGAALVISAVTAGSALAVAQAVATTLQAGQVFMDINSVAPSTKQAAHNVLHVSGACYVDAAVMAPLPPQRLQTPMLLGGALADELSLALNALGFNTRVVACEVGIASAIKMCRSVMIKGLEALTTECLTTARHYGAEQEVLASLHKSFPSLGWDADLPHYLISRVAEHGRRRAEEMEEVAQTVCGAGIEPTMSRAIATTQRALVDELARHDLHYADLNPFDWQHLAQLLRDRKK